MRKIALAFAAPLLFACTVQSYDAEEAPLGVSQEALSTRTHNLFFLEDVTGDGWSDSIDVTPDNSFVVDPSESGGVERVWLKHGGPPLEYGQIAFVDFNGDRKKDVIVQGYDNRFWVSLSSGTSFSAPGNWVTHGGGYRAGQAQYADVTGDGKTDLIYQGLNNQFWVSVSVGTGFRAPAVWVTHGGGFVAGQAKYGDVNGDKKADLVFQGNNNVFWISTSTGTGFRSPQAWVTGPSGTGALTYRLRDLNFDGKIDIVFTRDSLRWVSYSTGTGFAAPVRCGSC